MVLISSGVYVSIEIAMGSIIDRTATDLHCKGVLKIRKRTGVYHKATQYLSGTFLTDLAKFYKWKKVLNRTSRVLRSKNINEVDCLPHYVLFNLWSTLIFK